MNLVEVHGKPSKKSPRPKFTFTQETLMSRCSGAFCSCRRRSTSERFGRYRRRGPGKACRRDRKGSEPSEELATLPSIRIPQRHRYNLGSKRLNSNLSPALCYHSRGAKLSSQPRAPRFQASSLAQIDPVSLRPPHVEVSHARGRYLRSWRS